MEKNKNTEPKQLIENIPAGGEGEQSKIPPSRNATTSLEENILSEAEDNITNEQLSTNYSQFNDLPVEEINKPAEQSQI